MEDVSAEEGARRGEPTVLFKEPHHSVRVEQPPASSRVRETGRHVVLGVLGGGAEI